MSQELWDAVDDYLADHLLPPDELLDAVLQASTEAGLPAINVTAPQGKFLQLLARLHGARAILEIGTLGGYSTIWLARALPPDGFLLTLEANPIAAQVARRNFERAGLAELITVREGPALESLERMAGEDRGPFDVIFIDADKEHHPEYFGWALRLSRPGSLIIADNVVRGGEVLNPDSVDPSIQGIRRFFELIKAERRVEVTALQTVGSKGHDGFAIALVTE